MKACKKCCSTQWEEFGGGFSTCMVCGHIGFCGFALSDMWSCAETLVPRVSYTRKKRFKKYLNRACLNQGVATVPDATWEYLMSRGPYRTPHDVIRTLKGAKTLKRKCYDSLPVLARELCNCEVPLLSEGEKRTCLELFDRVDAAVPAEQPFVSYMFTLEYCLHKIGRQDLLPFLSRIQCRKRRSNYNKQLDAIFGTPCHVPELLPIHM